MIANVIYTMLGGRTLNGILGQFTTLNRKLEEYIASNDEIETVQRKEAQRLTNYADDINAESRRARLIKANIDKLLEAA